HFAVLLATAVEQPGERISELPFLAATERHQLLFDWNDTAFSLAPGGLFHELFAVQAQRAPGAHAISSSGCTLTYAELDSRADRLAQSLLAVGLEPEQVVVLWAERSSEFLIAMLAIWKAGGAYMPVDPRQPAKRLAQMVRQSGARLVLASAACF